MTYGENHYSGDAPHSEIGVTIKSKPVRVFGRIRAQHVVRELPDGRLESTYPLYVIEGGRSRWGARPKYRPERRFHESGGRGPP